MPDWLLGLLQAVAGGAASAIVERLLNPRKEEAPKGKPRGKHFRR